MTRTRTSSLLNNSMSLDRAVSKILAVSVLLVFAGTFISAQQPTRKNTQAHPPQISPAYQEAETLLNQGLLEEAKRKVQEELVRNPSSIEGFNLLGIIFSSQKNYEQALEAFQQALKLDPASPRTRNNIANVYLAQGKLELAEQELRTVLRSDPANRDANYNLGLILMAKHTPAEAIVTLQRVRPLNIETRLVLTRAYLQAGRTAEGLRAARELSAQKGDDVQLHFTLGILLASEKQYKAAQVELEKANSLKPETWEILYNLGQAHLRSNDYPKAEIALNRALKLKPDSPENLYLLAQVYSEQSKAVDALDLLVRAHKLAPENTDIVFLLARVSMTQNYFEDAIPLLESGIKIAPARADLHAALGESYFMSGKADKSVDEFKKLIEMDPTARSYAFLGLAYRHLGRFDEARKYFEAGVKQDPKNASCLFNLGFIEERQGNHTKAEQYFQQSLKANPDYSEALLELANLRVTEKKFEEAAVLLRKFVRVSRTPSSGYYKLAMVERSLHQNEAAQRDLGVFQTLSKDASTGPYPFQNLFDYLDNRSNLSPQARTQLDLTQLVEETAKHPDQPQNLYLLAEAYLKLGKMDEAQKAIAQLDQLSNSDFRTQNGVGVLLARFRLYDDAIQHFQSALHANADSDDVKFNLADAYFRKGSYSDALQSAQQISQEGQKDDGYLGLLGDIYARLGDDSRAREIFSAAIGRSPDRDQNYLSLALLNLRGRNLEGAEEILRQGQTRIPSSGKILWGLGLVSVLQGKTADAGQQFERAVDLLPEWPGSYSTLGVFYYQTGQIDKAREVLGRFKGSHSAGGLDLNRIEEALSHAPTSTANSSAPLPISARQQLLQFAFVLADRTL